MPWSPLLCCQVPLVQVELRPIRGHGRSSGFTGLESLLFILWERVCESCGGRPKLELLLLTLASAVPSLFLQQLLLIHATTPLLPPLLLCCATSPLSRDSASSSLYASAVADRGDSNLTCPYCMVFGLTGAGCGDSSATGPRRPLQLLQPSRHSCFCRLVYQLSALTVPSTCGTRLLHFPAGVADRTCMQLSLCFLAIRFQALVVILFTLRVPSVHQ